MATVSRGLPKQPHLDIPKREARELLQAWRAGNPEAFDRIRGRHPKFRKHDDAALAAAKFQLSDAQWVIAREYGLSSWPELKHRIASNSEAQALDQAIRSGDCAQVVELLRAHPALLHLPVRSGNWGPPMSHAANLGRLEIVQAVAALGARDRQHAFDRAVLQGEIETARWLHGQGAQLVPGIIMGACETLNAEGLQFLTELHAPFTDGRGDRLAPLALVLETYGRNPAGKHAVLEIFAAQGYNFPDTPMVAFHRGDIARLREHLRADPGLIERRFAYPEIYPAALGCKDDGSSGMHGTPLGGTTLLHLAIDFHEQELFDLLLAHGADVNAQAVIDDAGFGGQTPLFHAIVNSAIACGWQRDASMTQALLARGGTREIRAHLRKFLDWEAKPHWHEARNVTAAEWGRGFPHQSWVNQAGLELLAGG